MESQAPTVILYNYSDIYIYIYDVYNYAYSQV